MRAPRRLVRCLTVQGEERTFPAQEVRFRPAAYGVALQGGRVLVARSRFTGRWELPGGAVQPWESLEEGLAREYVEETGISVRVGSCVGFDQGFVAFFQHAFNSIRFFFVVEPADGALRPQAEEVLEVRWTPVEELHDDNMARNHHTFLQRALRVTGGAGTKGATP